MGAEAVRGRAYGLYVWAVTVCIGLPTWLLVHLLPAGEARWKLVRGAGALLCRAAGAEVTVAGLPPPGPFVVVANHGSYLDAFVLILAFREPLSFLAGAPLARQVVAGPFLRAIGCEFVGSDGRGRALLSELEDLLAAGRNLVVFPEGSLSPSPGLRRFHLGAFVVAARSRRPIVPVAIAGTRAVLAPGTRIPRRGRVTVSIGQPIDAGDAPNASAAARAAHEAVARLLGSDPGAAAQRGGAP